MVNAFPLKESDSHPENSLKLPVSLSGFICSCIIFFLVFSASPSFARHSGATLKPGIWQGILHRHDGQHVRFHFEASAENGGQVLYIINAGDRLLVDDIRQAGDSIWITLPFFAATLEGTLQANGNLVGVYKKNLGDRYQTMPFTAMHGKTERYPVAKPAYDIEGRWSVLFYNGKDTTKGVGEFEQEPGGKVTGSFLTPFGDYRYLEGQVSGDSLHLSVFDGGYAILFAAKINNDQTIGQGKLFSGPERTEGWSAKKDANAQLPDAYNVTKLRPGAGKMDFTFRSTAGDNVSISDKKFAGKVVILQILGSWCPNCLDETIFLNEYYSRNQQRGVEILGLAYERTESFEASQKALAPFEKRLQVKYPFLITGVKVSDPRRTEKTLPQIDNLSVFPTTIFLDKKGMVRKIHTGYSGPATGIHYEEYKKDFEETVAALLAE